MLESKMTLQLINAFFYIFSTSYSKILIDHRLSLLLNICDGYAINEGKKQCTKDNIPRVLTIDNLKEVKEFVNNRYGVSIKSFNDMIYGTRNELDHFEFDKKSARNAILLNRADNSFYLFLVYLFRTAFRATFLRNLCTDESAIAEIDKARKEATNKIIEWSEEVK